MFQNTMKTFLLLSIFFLNLTVAQGQTDSTDNYLFNWQIATGVTQTNFSALHKYEYLLDRPANTNFNYLSATIFIGNPKKFFVSILPIGLAFSRQHKGTYNGYTISATGVHRYSRLQLSFPLLTHFDRKGLQGIYLSVGGQYMKTYITSKAQGINPAMHDTTFYYESSSAKNFLANAEIMFELFRLGKQVKYARAPLCLIIGYNVQFKKPQWAGTYDRNIGDENPNVNQGGIYFGIGFNIWTQKKFWKGMGKTQKTNG
jgi:hypothetical protein